MITTKIMSLALVSMLSASAFAATKAVERKEVKDNKAVETKAIAETSFGKAISKEWLSILKGNEKTIARLEASPARASEAMKLLSELDVNNSTDQLLAIAALQNMSLTKGSITRYADKIKSYRKEGGEEVLKIVASLWSNGAIFMDRGNTESASLELAIHKIKEAKKAIAEAKAKGVQVDSRAIKALNETPAEKVTPEDKELARKVFTEECA